MHHLLSADTVVGRIAVGLQNALEVTQKAGRSFATASHAELEDRRTTRRSVLPQVALMICAPAIVGLHIDGCLIRLDVAPRKQLALDRSNHGYQHLSDGHHPAAHGGAADVDPRVAQQDDALTIERGVIGIFAYDGVDDALGQRCGGHTEFFAFLAGTLLAPGHLHEVLRRLHIQLFAYFVANHRRLTAAAAAYTLLWRAGNHPLHTRQFRRQRLAARVLTLLLFRRWRQHFAFALCGNFHVADAGFELQQLQLQAAQLLAARTVLGDPLQAQLLFEELDSQLGKLKPLRSHIQLPRCRVQLLRCRIQLPLQLFHNLGVEAARMRRRDRIWSRTHDVY